LKIPGGISIDVTDPVNFYYLTGIVLGLSILAMWYFTKTPLGAVMVGIRDNAQRVDYLGFSVPVTKAIIFAFSGAFAGIAGSMFALFQNVVSTDGVLHILVSFTPIMCILVGGLGTFSGPIWGSGILILMEEFTLRYTERAELVAGVVFVIVILFMPMGFVGLWNIAVARWRRSSLKQQSEAVTS
jgi:branched-chain amino acid transport system permease protein